MTRARTWERLAPASGIVFVVLLVVSTFMVPRLPAADAPAREIVAFFTEHRTGGLMYMRTAQQGSSSVIRPLYDLSSSSPHYASFLLALFLAAASLVMIQTGAVSRRLGWTGLIFAAIQLVVAGGVVSDTRLGLRR